MDQADERADDAADPGEGGARRSIERAPVREAIDRADAWDRRGW